MKKNTPIIIISTLFLYIVIRFILSQISDSNDLIEKDNQQEYNVNDLVGMDNGLWTEKFSDEPITGKVYGYFGENKPYKKVYVGNLRDGKREGKWVSYYHSTGKKKWEKIYKDGKRDGLHTEWFENGQKEYEGTYKNGELISQKRWNEDGSVKK